MTREELREHCKKEIEICKMWAMCKGEEPHGKVYEEHKLILELLEQEPVIDKIREEIEQIIREEIVVDRAGGEYERIVSTIDPDDVFEIIDKYRARSEPQESEGEK